MTTTAVRQAITFAVICHCDPDQSGRAEWTFWPSREAAEHALAELAPCGPQCIGIHTIARITPPIAGITLGRPPGSWR